ncbi:hypothetical protein NQ315_005148 [Exocentrus adspersus]|uniref:Tyr recombinase domain-containing protein n=1 Tax=Exocentrus adspersus TaxID=1586481 RepID=A0AAV8VUJ7_9CUCU|nr:hypothetical protein NQ315_005148 [Exocentrus adspersus]
MKAALGKQMFDNGLSYSVINTYRSAMNLIFAPSEEDRKNINRLLKGVAKMRPPHPKYKFTWDPDPVLSFVKNWYPLNRLNTENLTYKLVFLMAITSASRTQTLSKIKITDIIKLERKIEIRVTERIKTSAPNKFQPLLIFPYFREAPELCVAHTIETYLERTAQYRKDHEYLILTHKKPIHPATSQTISRWLKRVLKLGGVDTTVFSSQAFGMHLLRLLREKVSIIALECNYIKDKRRKIVRLIDLPVRMINRNFPSLSVDIITNPPHTKPSPKSDFGVKRNE